MKIDLTDLKKLIREQYLDMTGVDLLEAPIALDEAIKGNKYPFKAIFVFGPAGAGKSFISDQIGIPEEFRVSNPDEDIEAQFGNFGLSLKFAGKEDLKTFQQQQTFREKLQQATRAKTENWLLTATPVVFDTTGEKTKKMSDRITELAKAGYDIAILQINVPREISIDRDQNRARTVGGPTGEINDRYQREVAKDRAYFNGFSQHPRVTMLGGDIYANLFDLRTGEMLDGVTQDMVNAMKTKDGEPYTPEYAQSLLDEVKNQLRGFILLKEPNNPTGQKLYAGMLALVEATGGRAGNALTDFASVVQDEEIMAIPEIKAAVDVIESLGGAKEMFRQAQRGEETPGVELGTAVPDEDGNLQEPTAADLGTQRKPGLKGAKDFEKWRTNAIATIRNRDDLDDEEKRKRVEKLATMSKADRYTKGPALVAEQKNKLYLKIKEMVRAALLNREG